MTAITDYASLLVDAAEYAGRDDIAPLMGRFLGLAEVKLNRALRVADMEEEATVALVAGKGTLPDDFLEARDVRDGNGRSLRALPLTVARQPRAQHGFAVVGNTLVVRPATDGELSLTYYARIPALSTAAPVNWLIRRAPDVYLYAVAAEIAVWERDQQKAAAAMELLSLALSGLRIGDERARWGNASIVVGGPTP